MLTPVRVLFLFAPVLLAFGEAGSPIPVIAIGKNATPPAIVVGFVGGFVKHDNRVHSTVQVVEHLRNEDPEELYVQVFENRRREKAYKEILQRLDLNHDGSLSAEEKQTARIILFGHSWGAAAAVSLARKLEQQGIPVLLTIQVDSVSKIGQNDELIPANVEEAVNFYQPSGIVHGRSQIRAADPDRTQIIGNFRFDYKAHPIHCDGYPWFDRLLVRTHTEIECDPKVWNQVESLIYSKLSPQVSTTAKR